MNKTKRSFHGHLHLIDRVMKIMADNPNPLLGGLLYEDMLMFACQCMWHLKDWILNDPNFGAKDAKELANGIHSEQCLRICADLANGSKHLSLNKPKTHLSLSPLSGVHIEPGRWIFHQYYYVVSTDRNDPYHGMELRSLLSRCRDVWEGIIEKHYLTNVL